MWNLLYPHCAFISCRCQSLFYYFILPQQDLSGKTCISTSYRRIWSLILDFYPSVCSWWIPDLFAQCSTLMSLTRVVTEHYELLSVSDLTWQITSCFPDHSTAAVVVQASPHSQWPHPQRLSGSPWQQGAGDQCSVLQLEEPEQPQLHTGKHSIPQLHTVLLTPKYHANTVLMYSAI